MTTFGVDAGLYGFSEATSFEIDTQLNTPFSIESGEFDFLELPFDIHPFFPKQLKQKEFLSCDFKATVLVKEKGGENPKKLEIVFIKTEKVFEAAPKAFVVKPSSPHLLFSRPLQKEKGTKSDFSPPQKPAPLSAVKQTLEAFFHENKRETSSISREKPKFAERKHEESVSSFFAAKQTFKEKEDDQREGRRFKHENEEEDETQEENKKKAVSAINGVHAFASQAKHSAQSSGKTCKPQLEPPTASVFSLYYLLDKISIHSETSSYGDHKQEIEANQAETEEAHKKRMEQLHKAVEKEKQCLRWGISVKFFSWFTSLSSIFSGIAMIISGVGAVGGALLIAGGVLNIANQIMEMTHAWDKIAEILPGDASLEQKRAIVNWIQLGVAALSLIIAGAGIVFGGFSAMNEASTKMMRVIYAGVLSGVAVSQVGYGVESFFFKNRQADAKNYDVRLAQLKQNREDLMEKIEEAPDRLLHFYESLARNLGLLEEMNRAHQRAWT